MKRSRKESRCLRDGGGRGEEGAAVTDTSEGRDGRREAKERRRVGGREDERLTDLLVSLQQQRPALTAPDVPHDDAVVRGPGEQQPLDRVPPQRPYASWRRQAKHTLF